MTLPPQRAPEGAAPAPDTATARGGDTRAAASRSGASPRGTMQMWAALGDSIGRGSGSGGAGLDETVASVLHARAFRHFAEGARQYLALRLGSAEAADVALRRLRIIAGEWPATELIAPPGPRARLYRKARELAAAQRGAGGGPGASSGAALPWRPPAHDTPAAYRRALGEVRALPTHLAEVLELRFARELGEAEIAFVLAADGAQVEAMLGEATRRAEALLGPSPPSVIPGLAGALIEAFSLEPPGTATASVRASEEPGGIELGTVLGGRYRLEKRVGAGAFGEVYKAADTEVPGHVVALKLLHQPALSENARANALRELNLIASVFHPSIVQFKDHGWFAGRLWFVMPWYDGEPLEKRIAREPLTRAEARTFFEPIARALATMHASGLRHQDIKPDNIFLARLKTSAHTTAGDVLPVLLDLGVAAKDTEAMLGGTPLYFPPEIAAQFADVASPYPVTLAADVFSLALTLRNALEPSTQEDVPGGAVEAFIAHRAAHVPRAPVGTDLRYLAPHFERWLNPDPARRPTADAFADELAALTAPEERRARRARTLRWLAPLLAALGVDQRRLVLRAPQGRAAERAAGLAGAGRRLERPRGNHGNQGGSGDHAGAGAGPQRRQRLAAGRHPPQPPVAGAARARARDDAGAGAAPRRGRRAQQRARRVPGGCARSRRNTGRAAHDRARADAQHARGRGAARRAAHHGTQRRAAIARSTRR